ncbi:MAG: hypothetical protein IJA72_00620 [Clostridia bacterium]|nr:hypothetical protein [Clostridia bacterium]
MKKERIRTRKGAGFGKFILGWFVGFISTILIIAGVGYWAYTSISVGKIEKWTKSNIAGKNDKVRELTLEDAVNIAIGVAKGSNDYTLAKFEEDFGLKLVGDSLYGIKLEKLKNAPIKEIKTAVEDTINSATFNNILNFMEINADELGLLKTVLDSEITYYINDGKLCTAKDDISTEVDFNYTIEVADVKLDTDAKDTIVDGQVEFPLINLPLSTAVSSMSDATKDLMIYEIMDYHYDSNTDKYYQKYENGVYSNPVSGVMDAIAGFTIDELSDQEKIDALKIHEVMGYYYNETDKSYYTTSTFDKDTKVAGVMNALAGNTLGALSKEKTFNDLYIYQVMGYYYNESDTTYYQKYENDMYSNPVTGIMSTIAGKTVGGLDDEGAFNDVLLVDALGYTINGDKVYESNGTTEVTGVIKQLILKDRNCTISNIGSVVKTLTIGEVLDVEADDPDNSTIINALHGKTVDSLNDEIKKLKLGTILGVEENAPDNSPVVNALWGKTILELDGAIKDLTLGQALGADVATATGAVKVLFNTKITELNDAMGQLTVGEAMGYYYDSVNDKFYSNYDGTTYSNEVIFDGILGAIVRTQVNNLSSTITNLTAVSVFPEVDGEGKYTTTILNLFSETELKINYNSTGKGLTIMEMPNAVANKINSATIGYLVENGIITGVDQEGAYYKTIKDKTLSGLLNGD